VKNLVQDWKSRKDSQKEVEVGTLGDLCAIRIDIRAWELLGGGSRKERSPDCPDERDFFPSEPPRSRSLYVGSNMRTVKKNSTTQGGVGTRQR